MGHRARSQPFDSAQDRLAASSRQQEGRGQRTEDGGQRTEDPSEIVAIGAPVEYLKIQRGKHFTG